MRTFLLPLLGMATALCAQEVPVRSPEVPRGPDCTLPIPPTTHVPVHAEVDRWSTTPKDHVVLFVSGDVLLAGDCKSGALVLGLERLVDRAWEEVVPLPEEIPYCVPPNTTWERKRLEVDVADLLGRRITRKDRKGIWRFVLREVDGRPVASQAFQLSR
ncbi:MAG: hypothetical protein IPP83_09335 [Flavobacteriales bacterium]|nr:hypothetical protein [Flavobacteriales bacterium]